ncbi:MAG: 2-isopropylmalate synthase [Elusimicrobia bacterium]|nr:2-isopropylmalate synthase [Elusimicrobiota bacterium]
MSKNIIIFDTTLRDGEQSPGASLTSDQKLIIARELEKMKVDVIEAGFAISSPDDFKSIERISSVMKNVTVCSLARAVEKDIAAAAGALAGARHKRIHTFIATSPVHMKYKLRMSKSDVVSSAVEAVKLSRKFCDEVEFSCEDATRSDKKFLCEIVEKVISAGAGIINIPDTVGYAYPDEMGKLISYLLNNVKNSHKAVFSVHCHNDLGLATANSLASVLAGAGQVECTVNGLGERAGNAAMEEIVMALNVRFPKMKTRINTRAIARVSGMVSHMTGIVVQPNKAVVGANAFAHEAGIHQDGVLKKAQTYEIMRPEDVGISGTLLVLGKHSGRAALDKKLKELGFQVEKDKLNKIFADFKKLADKKKKIYDEDIIALIEKDMGRREGFELKNFEVHTTPAGSKGRVTLKKSGKVFKGEASGDGPVDSVLKAVEAVSGRKSKLTDYSVKSITVGKDAQGEVRLRAAFGKKVFAGVSSSTDIIEASILAYISAVNKLELQNVKKEDKK